MIILNKRLLQQRIIVTVSENTISSNLILTVNSAYSNKTYTLTLPENTSPFKGRYDEFLIDTPEWENGFYNYEITDEDGGIVETGTLEVIDGTTPIYISINTTETDDDFIVYNQTTD